MDNITLIGVAASACTGISLLPQLIKIAREKEPCGISYWVFLILISGLALWVVYGAMIGDIIIIISNALSLLINLSVLILDIYYKKNQPLPQN